MKVYFILLFFFQIYSVKSEDNYMYLYSVKDIDVMKKGTEYSFRLDSYKKIYNNNLALLIYLKDSSVSNPFSFSYELGYDYYDDGDSKKGQLEAKTTTDKGRYVSYTTFSYDEDRYIYYLRIKVQPNSDFENVSVVFIDNPPFEITAGNLILFIFAGICVLICVITLVKTKACGNKNESISNNQLPNSPIQPEIQIAQASEQNQPLL